MKFVGLDIGGANVKFASTDGDCQEIRLPFWESKDRLVDVLSGIRGGIQSEAALGVTMTAELADCFESKKDGVNFIVDAVETVFSDCHALFYQTDGTMCDGVTAAENWSLTAASNWHALAWFAFYKAHFNQGLVLDIGSTTTDIIPVVQGRPEVSCQDDLQRLSNGQLYYAGVGRTPVCSLLDYVNLTGEVVAIAREFFATTRDVFIWLGELPEDVRCCDTADGRTHSRVDCGRRLARMVCADLEEVGDAAVTSIAQSVRTVLVKGIGKSLQKVVERSDCPNVESFKVFGYGAFLASDVIAEAGLKHSGALAIEQFSDLQLKNQTAPALAVATKRQVVFESRLAN